MCTVGRLVCDVNSCSYDLTVSDCLNDPVFDVLSGKDVDTALSVYLVLFLNTCLERCVSQQLIVPSRPPVYKRLVVGSNANTFIPDICFLSAVLSRIVYDSLDDLFGLGI
jgi:hypothetical protein